MRTTSFPVSPANGPLCLNDFSLLASRFRAVLFGLVPTAGDARFLLIGADALPIDGKPDPPELGAARYAAKTGLPQKAGTNTLVFPICPAEKGVLVAEVSDVDPLVLEKASAEWLAETGQALCHELKRIKGEIARPGDGALRLQFVFRSRDGSYRQPRSSPRADRGTPPSRSLRDPFSPVLNTASLLKNYNRPVFSALSPGNGCLCHSRERSAASNAFIFLPVADNGAQGQQVTLVFAAVARVFRCSVVKAGITGEPPGSCSTRRGRLCRLPIVAVRSHFAITTH